MFFVRLLSLAAAVTAATIEIDVGKGGLAFSPDTVTAAKGDILEFHFVGGYHDAVKGDPAKPCTPLAGGFASATEAGSATNVSFLLPPRLSPIYYYCSVGAHCANGMVAVVNPTADDTAAAFKAAAKSATAVRPVGAPYGGEMTTTD